jgi:hypothetical protein
MIVETLISDISSPIAGFQWLMNQLFTFMLLNHSNLCLEF